MPMILSTRADCSAPKSGGRLLSNLCYHFPEFSASSQRNEQTLNCKSIIKAYMVFRSNDVNPNSNFPPDNEL